MAVRLGATWIDPKYVQQFMHELFSTEKMKRESAERMQRYIDGIKTG